MERSSRISKKQQDDFLNKAKNNPDIKRLIEKRLNNMMSIKEYEVTLHHKSVESYRTTIKASSKEEAEEIAENDFYGDAKLEWENGEVSDGECLDICTLEKKTSDILGTKAEDLSIYPLSILNNLKSWK